VTVAVVIGAIGAIAALAGCSESGSPDPAAVDAGADGTVAGEGDAASDGGSDSATGGRAPTFCERNAGASVRACNDFEDGSPVTGWSPSAEMLTFGLDDTQGYMSARSGLVAIPTFGGGTRHARLTLLDSGAATNKAYLTAMIKAAPLPFDGEIFVALLELKSATDQPLRAIVHRSGSTTTAELCGPNPEGGVPCHLLHVASSLVEWTKIEIEVEVSGTVVVRADGVPYSRTFTPIASAVKGRADVGAVVVVAGGERRVSVDDALVTVE
jgi:hypothetical protein